MERLQLDSDVISLAVQSGSQSVLIGRLYGI